MFDALSPVELNEANLPIVNTNCMRTSHAKVWCGGDLAGVAETTVEAVNDGKTAAWYMHCYLEVCNKVTLKTLVPVISDKSFANL